MRAEGWRRALAGASTPCALSSTHETIRRAAQRGHLESVRIGLDRIYAESAVQGWLELNRDHAAAAAARQTGISTTRRAAR